MKETKTFTITTSSPIIMRRIERFFAMLHYNSCFGHSNLFGMRLDGDGSETVVIENLDKSLAHEVNAIGGVGYDVEIANDDNYNGRFIDRNRKNFYQTRPAANLYKNGKLIKTIPGETIDDDSENKLRCGGASAGVDVGSFVGAGGRKKASNILR